jgi:pimeloyl-ACP methyl ester carboxylesterase
MTRHLPFTLLLCLAPAAFADGPADNKEDAVRRIPKPGVTLPESDRAELQAGVERLSREIDALRGSLAKKPALLGLLPDVQVYHNAVRYALTYDEFFDPKEIAVAKSLVKQGQDRADQLRGGQAPWTTATGLVVRGYVSKIDGSVQPYGLVVPASYQANSPHHFRLDLWWHGRGETLSELSFIDGRQKSPGEFTPRDAFVLHPYGRYCNANRFAGEVDTFEAIAHVKKNYPIDEDRVVARGFSMGGAACWQFATHYPGVWCAAAPGAGFSETIDFLTTFQREVVNPTWYQRKLWHWYDSADYAVNLANCPTVAYSGEIDRQKQAADVMAKALATEGIEMVHVIGPKTEHRYHSDAKVEINRRIDAIAAAGRNPVPPSVHFTTWTLRYNEAAWVRVDALKEHWERARVDASILDGHNVQVTTVNVTGLSLVMPPGRCPFDVTRRPLVRIDGQEIETAPVLSDRSWSAHFRKTDQGWRAVASADDGTLRKRHGLQGPIDDAFMDRFLMVRPTGKPSNERVGAWVKAEMTHALDHWRRQFRGEAPVKDDVAVTAADVADSNLILWGDPSSNAVLARIADKLPVRWDAGSVRFVGGPYSAENHVAVMVYPNPLNPKRYVVLNSGFTYRDYDYLNNARQTPKLPDFAILDVSVPPSSRSPGKVEEAGFFDESWKLPVVVKGD